MAYPRWKLQMQLILLEGCSLFELLLLFSNSYDRPSHADVRLVNQYLMPTIQTLGRSERLQWNMLE